MAIDRAGAIGGSRPSGAISGLGGVDLGVTAPPESGVVPAGTALLAAAASVASGASSGGSAYAARKGDRVGSHGRTASVPGMLGAAVALLTGGPVGAAVGLALGFASLSRARAAGPCSAIKSGSPNVKIEGQPAARAGLDDNDHGRVRLIQGSAKVFVNGRPLVRVGDRSACQGVVTVGARKTMIGGPQTSSASSGGGAAGAARAALGGVGARGLVQLASLSIQLGQTGVMSDALSALAPILPASAAAPLATAAPCAAPVAPTPVERGAAINDLTQRNAQRIATIRGNGTPAEWTAASREVAQDAARTLTEQGYRVRIIENGGMQAVRIEDGPGAFGERVRAIAGDGAGVDYDPIRAAYDPVRGVREPGSGLYDRTADRIVLGEGMLRNADQGILTQLNHEVDHRRNPYRGAMIFDQNVPRDQRPAGETYRDFATVDEMYTYRRQAENERQLLEQATEDVRRNGRQVSTGPDADPVNRTFFERYPQAPMDTAAEAQAFARVTHVQANEGLRAIQENRVGPAGANGAYPITDATGRQVGEIQYFRDPSFYNNEWSASVTRWQVDGRGGRVPDTDATLLVPLRDAPSGSSFAPSGNHAELSRELTDLRDGAATERRLAGEIRARSEESLERRHQVMAEARTPAPVDHAAAGHSCPACAGARPASAADTSQEASRQLSTEPPATAVPAAANPPPDATRAFERARNDPSARHNGEIYAVGGSPDDPRVYRFSEDGRYLGTADSNRLPNGGVEQSVASQMQELQNPGRADGRVVTTDDGRRIIVAPGVGAAEVLADGTLQPLTAQDRARYSGAVQRAAEAYTGVPMRGRDDVNVPYLLRARTGGAFIDAAGNHGDMFNAGLTDGNVGRRDVQNPPPQPPPRPGPPQRR